MAGHRFRKAVAEGSIPFTSSEPNACQDYMQKFVLAPSCRFDISS
jgi:hypothetical protein